MTIIQGQYQRVKLYEYNMCYVLGVLQEGESIHKFCQIYAFNFYV